MTTEYVAIILSLNYHILVQCMTILPCQSPMRARTALVSFAAGPV